MATRVRRRRLEQKIKIYGYLPWGTHEPEGEEGIGTGYYRAEQGTARRSNKGGSNLEILKKNSLKEIRLGNNRGKIDNINKPNNRTGYYNRRNETGLRKILKQMGL